MKKINVLHYSCKRSLFILLLVFTSLISQAQVSVAPSIGNGSLAAPYQITNFANLLWLSENTTVWGQNFIQTADIDASATANPSFNGGLGWSPIGTFPQDANWNYTDLSFYGVYNGQGHTISNLYINRPTEQRIGLFGRIGKNSVGLVTDVHLINVNINALDVAGAVVGQLLTKVDKSSATGTVSSAYVWSSSIGGIAGQMEGSSEISLSSANVSVIGTGTGANKFGGFCGTNYGTISNSFAVGSVTANAGAGGFVGDNSSGIITNCYSTGSTVATTNRGGFVSINTMEDPGSEPWNPTYISGTITSCFWDSEASGLATSDGGTAKTTLEMKTAATFTNWNFSTIWSITPLLNSGYPDFITGAITEAPTASAQTFCSGATVADLVATGTNLQWYDADTGGTALASTNVLATGTYYVSQTVSGSESTRTSVAVTILTSTDQTTFSSGGLNYEVTSPTTVAVGDNTGASGSISIPASVSNGCFDYTVSSIDASAFEDCDSLTSVTIPNSVTSISDVAFNGCSSLTSVTIGNSVTSIGYSAFKACSSLTSVTIPDSVTSIGYSVFEECFSLTSVTIGNSVTSIGSYAFVNCTGLTSVTIPNSVTSIGSDTFTSCSSLTSVTIGNSVTSIGGGAFQYCSSLTSVTIGNSVTSIGESAFYDCSSLPSVIIPNSVTSIGAAAFYSCTSLTSVTIPSSVTSIGAYAFYGCSSLTSVVCEIVTPLSIPSNVFTGVNQSTCTLTVPAASVAAYQAAAVWQNFAPITCATPTDNTTTVTACASYTWANNSQTYTTSGTYTGTTTNCVTEKLVLTIISTSTDQTTFSSGGLNYEVTSPTTVAVGNNSGASGSISIPASVTNGCFDYTVSSIGASAFESCSGLTSVIIPESVTSIGDVAFYDCYSLTSVTIPNSVTSIGYNAFSYCSSLTSVTIPNSLTSIESETFYECSSLISVIIGNSVTSIGDYAFDECSSLTSVIIPDSVTSIGNNAFSSCSSLTSVTIPNSVTSIGYNAFSYCSSLPSVIIPNSVTSIESETFEGCSGLTSVIIPDSVTSIGEFAFYDCTGLPSVIIPNSVTSIGTGAFEYCSSLTSVTIPSSVTSIGAYAFSDCSSLTSVVCTIETPLSIPSTVFEGVNQSACSLLVPSGSVAAYEAAAVWQDFAFITSGAINTTTISACDTYTWSNTGQTYTTSGAYIGTTTNSVTEVLYLNFNTSTPGTTLTSNGLNYIVTSPTTVAVGFNSGTSGGVIIPASITLANSCTLTVSSIYNDAFYENSGLTSVTIPDTVTSIASNAFSNCSSLTSVIIPNSVTSIGQGTFYGCSSLTSVIIPETVTSIGGGAFQDCSGLTSVTIGNAVTSIGGYTFSGCSSLTSVTIPNSVTSIGNDSFVYCSGLTLVTIGNAVTSIGVNAFYGCSSLTSVIIPNSVTSINNGAFGDCTGLTSVTIGNSVNSIDDNAFRGCSSLPSVTIPNSVTSVGGTAFYGCSNLTSVTIPSSVTSIGAYAFYGCSSLTSVVCEIVTPLSINSSDFGGVNQSACTLLVPAASVAAYQAAAVWQDFAPIICTPTENTTTVTACASYTWADNSQSYTTSGTYTGTTTNCVTEQLVLTITSQLNYYLDADSDGYYTGSAVSSCTSPGAGYTLTVTGGGDCDDTKAVIHPGAIEICYDGIDNDCDGTVDNGCAPLVTVVQTTQCGQTLANIDDYVYANLVSGAQGYRFKVTNMVTNEVQTIDRFLRVFRITQLPNYAFNTEYKVEVAVRKNNVWQPFYGAPCTVKTPAATTQLINCGASLTAMTDIIYASSVSFATGYQFKVTNVLNPSDTRTSNRSLREFRMSLLSGIQYNTTYTVEVAVRNTDGATYLPYGPVCEVTTPNFPASYLQDSQCDDYLVPSNATILYAQSFTGAEGYRFRLQNSGLGYSQEVDRALRTFRLSDFTGLTPGSTYTVKVALKINGVWGSYTGKGCSIIIPGGARAVEAEAVVAKANFAAVAYPNPFANTFAIQVQTSSQEVVQLKVYDMLGRLVEQRETNAKEITAFGDRYPSGVYNVVVTQGNVTETLRVIKR